LAPSEEPLSQGQLLFGLTVQLPDYTKPENRPIVDDFIVCTQSCDIDEIAKFDFQLLLARMKHVEPGAPGFGKDKIRQIAKGYEPNAFLLPPSAARGISGYLVCNLADLYCIPARVLTDFCKNQPSPGVRLARPFRELFSRCLGNAFSRVELRQNTWNRTDFVGTQKTDERQPLEP